MPIHFRENQYRGINAHLNSYLQTVDGNWWEVFHNAHIENIREQLDQRLPSQYFALGERSLQIYDPYSALDKPRLVKPDVSIYQRRESAVEQGSGAVFVADAPYVSVDTADTLDEEEYRYRSVMIYKREESELIPVTRIELLSPSNKPPHSEHRLYLDKRRDAIASRINLVEIDYLHQTPSPFRVIRSYPARQTDSFPYTILVTDQRQGDEYGKTHIYVARVDESLPVTTLPLLNTDAVAFDAGLAYNTTFERNRFYGDFAVDYEQLPHKFDSYSPDDQERIKARMEMVKVKSTNV